jgi:CheY-like chemotaxis protein
VEDNPDGRESLRLLLSILGHRVDVAADGVEGVTKAVLRQPDIALIDIGLPLLDGYQVARRIRALLGQRIILIAYTAYDSPEARERVVEAGFDAHLVKPIELRELAPWLDVGPLSEPAAIARVAAFPR